MSKLYKLTDINGITRPGHHNACQWGPGVTHSGTGEGGLCSPGYIHTYEDPWIAVMLNPIHACYEPARMWEAEGVIAVRDGQIKCGCVSLTTVREIPMPTVTTEQRVRFAIRAAKAVCDDSAWNAWADRWLPGEDRSKEAVGAAAAAAAAAEAAGIDIVAIARQATGGST